MEGLIALIILAALYFIPFIIGVSRGIKNSMSVFFLNLFLGWTVIGFFVLIFYQASLTLNQARQWEISFQKEKRKKENNYI